MDESFDQISGFKWEINLMKEKTKSYRKTIGDVTPGRTIVPALKTQLQIGIRVRGFPESTATTADDQMLKEVAAVDKLLKFMEIEDRKLTKISRFGKYDPKRETPRTFLFKTDSSSTKELIFKSTHEIAKFEEYEKPIYLSAELHVVDSKRENECLKRRREFIDKVIDRKLLRIRNFLIETLVGKQ